MEVGARYPFGFWSRVGAMSFLLCLLAVPSHRRLAGPSRSYRLHFHSSCYKTMIARSTAGRLAGEPIKPLSCRTLHQHEAAGAIFNQQDAEAQHTVSGPIDDISTVTVQL
jgi:hypothetical protein